jgi:uncharacterized protein
MNDSAHDKDHVYRVLYLALHIAERECERERESEHSNGGGGGISDCLNSGGGANGPEIDRDVLIAACLLHDIGRSDQFANPAICHAEAGSEKALRWLRENGWPEEFARHAADCILTHRFRSGRKPATIEAKVLFDADKLEVAGAIGIARTLQYKAHTNGPLYTATPDGDVCDGVGDTQYSFMQEYKYKLVNIYSGFHTECASQIARERQGAAAAFYESLLGEARMCHGLGVPALARALSRSSG